MIIYFKSDRRQHTPAKYLLPVYVSLTGIHSMHEKFIRCVSPEQTSRPRTSGTGVDTVAQWNKVTSEARWSY